MNINSYRKARTQVRAFINIDISFIKKTAPLAFLVYLSLFFICVDPLLASQKYVGPEGCKCHRSEIMDWEGSKHAKAFDLLLPNNRRVAKKRVGLNPSTDYSRDAKCIKCHVVGYMATDGFKDIDTTPMLAGVGCESCHGPGGKYRILHGKKPRTFKRSETKKLGQVYSSIEPSICRRCHEHPDSPFQPSVHKKYRFDFKKALTKTSNFHNYYPMKAKH